MKIYPEKVWIDVDSKDKPFILHNEATMGMCAYIRSDIAHAAPLREPLGSEGWRPIESAPLNESILGHYDGYTEVTIVLSEYARKFLPHKYWQPLPSPPSTKPEEKE